MISNFNGYCKKVFIFLINIDGWKLILIGICLNFLFSIFFSSIARFFFDEVVSEGIEKKFGTIADQALWILIIAPLFETLFFQYFIIENLNKKFSPYLSCFISALLFGLSHTYNLYYFAFAFFSGIIFALIYYIGSINKRGIIYALLTHVIYNTIAFIINKVNL
jgi:membrane protease YdiL (CAAX protease family)